MSRGSIKSLFVFENDFRAPTSAVKMFQLLDKVVRLKTLQKKEFAKKCHQVVKPIMQRDRIAEWF